MQRKTDNIDNRDDTAKTENRVITERRKKIHKIRMIKNIN